MAIRRYALLDGEDVVNVIIFDNVADDYEPEAGLNMRLAAATVGPGWKRINDAWVAPPPAERDTTGDDPPVDE